MKKSKILFLTIIAFLFIGCNTGNTSENPSGNTAQDKFLNLDELVPWDDKGNGTYDKAKNKITITEQYSAVQIWFNDLFDASGYDYLKITYENATHDFGFSAGSVNPEGSADTMCSVHLTTAYLPLTALNKKSIRKVLIVRRNETEDFSVVVKSICFTNSIPQNKPETDTGDAVEFNNNISAINFVKQMKAGWNLGNTLDAYGAWIEKNSLASETCWGEPYTTKEIVSIGKQNGFKTIRISTTWYNHIIDDNYTIDGEWMRRVKQVVDWAIDDGYYVILDDHHSVREGLNKPLKYGEGYIIRNTPEDIAESKAFLEAIWKQIAAAFNNSYDEHLIFETMNEPRNPEDSHGHTWQPGLTLDWVDNSKCEECLADYEILNEYNQLCLDTIRASGGNNANRFVMIPSLCTGKETPTHELFTLPQDSATDKLIITVHDYIMGVSLDLISEEFTDSIKSEIDSTYQALNEKFISKGVPVVVGEAGALRKIPLTERVKWITYFGSVAKNYGMSIVYWECGGTKDDDFSIIDRKNLCVRTDQKDFAIALTGAFVE